MKKMYFKYGNGKTADLCQTAYNYLERGAKVIVINAKDNSPVESKVETDKGRVLKTDVNDQINPSICLFARGFYYKEKKIDAILVDNAHYLTEEQALELFYISKIFDITVFCYSDRVTKNGYSTPGSMRLMELSNIIEPVDGDINYAHKSNLQFYYGAMNCSKTAKLIYSANQLEQQRLKVSIIKPGIDREEKVISSRIGLRKEADIVLNAKDLLYGLGQYLYQDHVNFILVDEAQFLTIEQINDLKRINQDYNIPVRCYGLKTDFMTKHFPGSGRLLEIADQLEKLRTVCSCEAKSGAEFNARKWKNGGFIKEGDQLAVDNSNAYEYISLCEECYIKDVMGIDINNPKQLLKTLCK